MIPYSPPSFPFRMQLIPLVQQRIDAPPWPPTRAPPKIRTPRRTLCVLHQDAQRIDHRGPCFHCRENFNYERFQTSSTRILKRSALSVEGLPLRPSSFSTVSNSMSALMSHLSSCAYEDTGNMLGQSNM